MPIIRNHPLFRPPRLLNYRPSRLTAGIPKHHTVIQSITYQMTGG